jgi:cytochrome c oxidase subunit 3
MSAVTVSNERARREMTGPILGMVLFVASEAMFFAAFFGAYFTIRANATAWPPKGIPHLKIDVASILTVILVSSSVVLQIAIRAIRKSNLRRAMTWLGATVVLGVTFLELQFYDYSQLGFGVKDGPFGTLFYVMTGLHMAHVFGGVIFLSLVLGQGVSGKLSLTRYEPIEAGAIYWHFVDVVWLCLFSVFYLLTPR